MNMKMWSILLVAVGEIFAAFLLEADLTVPPDPPSSRPAKEFIGKLQSNYDGDTITVVDDNGTVETDDDRREKVRLNRIDAPELKQEYGKESKAALTELCKDKKVAVTWYSRDRYGRVLGEVWIPGTLKIQVTNDTEEGIKGIELGTWMSVNEEMILMGHAWQYKAYNKSKRLAELENDARKKSWGLWKASNPTPPWEYRKQQQKKLYQIRGWRVRIVD